MRILFAGTPQFAVPPLEALIAAGQEICAVYTQPDRPSGRGRKLTPSPVKTLAQAHGIPVYQPESLKTVEDQQTLLGLKPDLMVVVAYGLILPKCVIDCPPLGCVNIHASLLPRWRGAAPIQRSIFYGDEESGVTIMFIEPKLDAGPMLHKKRTRISPTDTSESLHDRLSTLGAEALMETLSSLQSGTVDAKLQDESLVTYACKQDKQEALIDWTDTAESIDRKVRAFNPWPVAETDFNQEKLRIWRSEPLEGSPTAKGPIGQIDTASGQLDVLTGQGVLRLHEVQLPGGKRISGRDFINAYGSKANQLGSNH